MMSDINVFNANMKLSVFCESDCVLIIFKNYNNLKIRIVKSQKLIEKIFQLNNFLNNLRLINILYFINE